MTCYGLLLGFLASLLPSLCVAGEREDFLRMLLTANNQLELGVNPADLKAAAVKIKKLCARAASAAEVLLTISHLPLWFL